MKRNKFAILFAVLFVVLVLVFVSLVFSSGSQSGVSRVFMTADEGGEEITTVYSPLDDFYLYIETNAVDVGTVFEVRLYVLNIEGEDSNTIISTDEHTVRTESTNGPSWVFFHYPNNTEWRIGTYRVDVYMDGTKVGETQFSVQ